MPKYINFITLQTGDIKRSYPNAISDIAKNQCTDLITAALLNTDKKTPIPLFDGYFLQLNNLPLETVLFGSIFCGDCPIATFVYCPNSKHSKRLWQLLHEYATNTATNANNNPVSAPWLAATVYPSALSASDMSWVMWLSGLEESLAWAWVDYER